LGWIVSNLDRKFIDYMLVLGVISALLLPVLMVFSTPFG